MGTWLVTGAAGMLGADLVDVLRKAGERVRPMRRQDLNITDPHAVDAAVEDLAWDHADAGEIGPAVVVNAAAYTDVDGAEEDEETAFEVNAAGAAKVAWACEQFGVRLIHVSTDYVFDGTGTEPYAEDAPVSPINAYGRSKAAGEREVLETLPESAVVLRTGWLYGQHGRHFASLIVRLAREREQISVVADQNGQPTWTRDVAVRILELGQRPGASGIFHATNSGATTRYGWARSIFAELGLDQRRLLPASSAGFPRPAARPAYTVLGHDRWYEIGLRPMRRWEEALADAAPSVLGGS